MIGSAAVVNDGLTMTRQIAPMSKIFVTPEFLNLDSPIITKAILQHIISHADIVGEDSGGRPVMRFEFACEPWLMDKLAGYGAAKEDYEAEAEEA